MYPPWVYCTVPVSQCTVLYQSVYVSTSQWVYSTNHWNQLQTEWWIHSTYSNLYTFIRQCSHELSFLQWRQWLTVCESLYTVTVQQWLNTVNSYNHWTKSKTVNLPTDHPTSFHNESSLELSEWKCSTGSLSVRTVYNTNEHWTEIKNQNLQPQSS